MGKGIRGNSHAVWFHTAPPTRHGQNHHQSAIIPYNGVTVIAIFHCIWITMEKLFMKWAHKWDTMREGTLFTKGLWTHGSNLTTIWDALLWDIINWSGHNFAHHDSWLDHQNEIESTSKNEFSATPIMSTWTLHEIGLCCFISTALQECEWIDPSNPVQRTKVSSVLQKSSVTGQ